MELTYVSDMDTLIEAHESAQPTGRTPALRRLVVGLMSAPFVSLMLVDSRIPMAPRVVAGVFWILCLLPVWFYLGIPAESRRPLPLLPFVGILYGLYYPLSVLLGGYNEYYKITVVPETDYVAPMMLGLLGWILLLAGYLLVQASKLARARPWGDEWNTEVVRKWAVRMVLLGAITEIIRRFLGIPVVLGGSITFIASLAQFGIALLVFLGLRYGISLFSKMVLALGIGIELLLGLTGGTVAPVVHVTLVVLFAIWIARQTLSMRWISTAILALLMMVSVKGVLLEFRRVAWFGGGSGVGQQVELLQRLVNRKVADEGVFGTVTTGLDAVTNRSALSDLFADVIRRTPAQVPYWDGETYLHLVGSVVPRFLWPGKPQHHVGNDFGHRYGFVQNYDTWTSWNLPVMVEFFVNFGEIGVIAGMFVTGILYGLFVVVFNKPAQSPLISMAGVVLAMMLINIESDFSLMFGALFMQGTALWLVLRMIARDSRRAKLRKAMSGEILNSGDWVTA